MGIFRKKGEPSASAKEKKKRSRKLNDLNVSVRIGKCCRGIDADHVRNEFIDTISLRMSQREISLINADGGIQVTVVLMDERYQAEYTGFSKGKHQIVIRPDAFDNPETITHEVIHILQEIDGNRPELDRQLARDSKRTYEDSTLREAMTEAEAVGRQDNPDLINTPFYDNIEEDCLNAGHSCCPSAADMKDKDHRTLTKNTGKGQGEKTIVYVHQDLPLLEIARYRDKDSTMTAKQRFDDIHKNKIRRTAKRK